MQMFYSAKEAGFYTKEIHGDNMPEDVVPVTPAKYQSLMDAQARGKQIVGGDDGHPVSVVVGLSEKEAFDNATLERNNRLAATDWVTLRAVEKGEPVPEVWVKYRQALRDVPQQSGYPFKINWPKAPE